MTIQQKSTRPVLLIDALNVFTRHYTANPTFSAHGQPMGGVVGFLYAVRKLVEEQRPRQVIVAWEGGGSTRRRQLYSDYKAKRKPTRLNRSIYEDLPNTVENRDEQVKALVACLKHTPVCQVYVENCEADDVIAYLVRTRYCDENVVIVSSDKDYYQLLSDNVKIFRPGKKTYVTKDDMFQEFAISPRNFPLAKAICGDVSDNIPGVKGVGFKSIAKRFPEFASDDELDVDYIITETNKHVKTSKTKMFKSILESEALIKRNLQLVALDGRMLNPDQRKRVDYQVDTFEPVGNKINLIRELVTRGLIEFNADDFYYTLASTLR